MTEFSLPRRIRISPAVARILAEDAPHSVRLDAARGALPLGGRDLLTVLMFLHRRPDEDLRREALRTLRSLPGSLLREVIDDPQTPEQLLHLIARARLGDAEIISAVIANPATADATLLGIARQGDGAAIQCLAQNARRLAACPEIAAAIASNPKADPSLRRHLAVETADESPVPASVDVSATEPSLTQEDEEIADVENGEAQEDEINPSKYQLSLEMPVAEKIKMALTGDKEWRTILLRDSNKLVCGAVLKNPRITDGEVLAVARNRSSNDELIRLILLNVEWVKVPEIRKALVVHPRTPLPKALRFLTGLSEKELKHLAKSRNVSQVIANSARRMLMAKEKKS